MVIYFDGLVQDCNDPIASALEVLQSCTKPSIYSEYFSTLLAYQHECTASVDDM